MDASGVTDRGAGSTRDAADFIAAAERATNAYDLDVQIAGTKVGTVQDLAITPMSPSAGPATSA